MDNNKYRAFWHNYVNGSWEPRTISLFDQLITKNITYIDVGAWIGPTLLYATQLAKKSYAFEPDPYAFSELSANVKANPHLTNIKIFNLFVGANTGTITMGSRAEMGDSMSSILFSESDKSWSVESVQLKNFIRRENIDSPIFMKIDIEGGEYSLIPSLRGLFQDYDITLYLSLHPDFLARTIPGKNIPIKIKRRLILFMAHIRLLIGIRPLRFTYDIYGNRINLWKGLFRVFRGNSLLSDCAFVAMKRPWK